MNSIITMEENMEKRQEEKKRKKEEERKDRELQRKEQNEERRRWLNLEEDCLMMDQEQLAQDALDGQQAWIKNVQMAQVFGLVVTMLTNLQNNNQNNKSTSNHN